MKRIVVILAVVCIMAVLPHAWAAKTVTSQLALKPGTYKGVWTVPEGDQKGPGLDGPYGYCNLDDKLQDQVKGKPAFKSEKPKFGQLTFSSEAIPMSEREKIRGILLALDESGGTGKGYDTLYLDVNRNLDLSDDPAVTGKVTDQGSMKNIRFESAAKLPYNQLTGGSNTNIARIDIQVAQPTEKYTYCSAFLNGCWSGEIDSNHGKIPFRLADMSGDGVYGTNWDFLSEIPKMGDAVQLALAGDKDFGDANDPYNEQYFFSKAVSVAGKLYVFKPSESGDKLEVAAYAGPVAHLAFKTVPIGKTPLKVKTALAAGETGIYWLPKDGKSMNVPAGKYKVYMAELEVIDSKGKTWSVQAMPTKNSIISLAKGKTVTAKIGGPIKMSIGSDTPDIALKPGGELNVNLAFTFSTGQNAGGINQIGSRAQPNIVLKNAKGKVLDKQTAGFG